MKIAVYAIAKNEEQFVARWLKSAIDADYILLVDTGSTDETISKLTELSRAVPKHVSIFVGKVHIDPWRFEDARNWALAILPADIDVCIALDLDEVLVKDWRKLVEKYWTEKTDRLRYNYIWSWQDDHCTEPGLTYHGDKIHRRNGYRWVNPVHEVLSKDARLGPEVQTFMQETLIEHYPDTAKSRANYLPLLELATKENPWNDRNAHYYARDLMFAQRYEEAIKEFKRHLALSTAVWKPERAASYRYLGDCYFALKDFDNALKHFSLAIEEDPTLREGYVALAQYHRAFKDWWHVMVCCEKALKITERPNHYINWASAWSDWPAQMYKEAEEKYLEQSVAAEVHGST